MGQLQAEAMGRSGLLGLWILGKEEIHEVLAVVMMRFLAVTGSSCLAVRSLIVFLAIIWLIKVRSLSTLA